MIHETCTIMSLSAINGTIPNANHILSGDITYLLHYRQDNWMAEPKASGSGGASVERLRAYLMKYSHPVSGRPAVVPSSMSQTPIRHIETGLGMDDVGRCRLASTILSSNSAPAHTFIPPGGNSYTSCISSVQCRASQWDPVKPRKMCEVRGS